MSTPWESKLHDLIWTFDDNEPRFRHEKWKKVFDDQIKTIPLTIMTSASPLFSLALGEDEVKFTTPLTRDALWSRFSTLSQIAVLEGDELEVSLSRLFPSFHHSRSLCHFMSFPWTSSTLGFALLDA
jgi:hypothetical protein